MAILEPPPLTPKTRRRLGLVEKANPKDTPRVLILDGAGTPLLVSGEITLPVALSGVTKLFTLAMILREFERGAMSPDSPVIDLVPPETVEGLCVRGGVDRSETLTVEHLLSHRSGIVDYYQPGPKKVVTLANQSERRDRSWSDAQALEIARHYPAHFAPGARNRVSYSATNYLLLGMILAQSTGMTFEQLINLRVTSPLGLTNTFVFTDASFERYFSLAPIYLHQKALRTPQTLASFGAVGSLVSTARDMTVFLRAFASGELFGDTRLPYLTQSLQRLSPGITLGNGVMVPRDGSQRTASFFGHAGSSGTAALIDSTTGAVGFLATNALGAKKAPLLGLAGLMESVLG